METTTTNQKESKYDSFVIAFYCFTLLAIICFWTGLYYLGAWIISLF